MSTSPEDKHNHASAKKSVFEPLVKKTITIMLVGETGSGKTTFMSLLVNLFQGNTIFELANKNDGSKESGLAVTKSQTTKATLYTVTTLDGAQIRILDTPGLADTRGLQQDDEHLGEINRAIQAYATQIDAIIVMANGSNERITTGTKYTLGTIASMFPKTIVDNIALILTNSGRMPNFHMESLPDSMQQSRTWTIQNPLATYKGYRELEKKGATAAILKDELEDVEKNYRRAVESLQEWLKWLDQLRVQRTTDITILYNKSLQINQNIQSTLGKLDKLQKEELTSRKTANFLENAKSAKSAVDGFLKSEAPTEWVAHKTDKFNTICTACWHNCHVSCGLNQMSDSLEIARWCAAFSKDRSDFIFWSSGSLDSHCNDCQHEARVHRHEFNTYKKTDRPSYVELKKKVADAENEEKGFQLALQGIQTQITQTKGDIEEAQASLHELVESYNSLALNKDFTGHINATIDLLLSRKKQIQLESSNEQEWRTIDELLEKLRAKLDLLKKKKVSN